MSNHRERLAKPRMTKFWQGQGELVRLAVKDTLAVDTVRAWLGRSVELLAEEPPMRRFALEMGLGRVELGADVEPLVDALRAKPETFRSSLEKLAEAARECSPVLRHAYAGDRLRELLRFFAHVNLALAWGVDPSQFLDEIPDRIDHYLPDNPITIMPEGAVVGWELADTRHWRQLEAYKRSLRPEGRPGRPPKEEALALVVYARDRDGQHWIDIARAELPQYNLYDKAEAKRAYSHVRRLRERGQILAASQEATQESP